MAVMNVCTTPISASLGAVHPAGSRETIPRIWGPPSNEYTRFLGEEQRGVRIARVTGRFFLKIFMTSGEKRVLAETVPWQTDFKGSAGV